MHFRILLPIILWFFTFSNCENPEKVVKTRVHAKWKQTSILAEISEYLASQDETKFWRFVDAVNEKLEGNSSQYSSHLQKYENGMSIASNILNPSEIGLLRFSLSIRQMSPRIEVHRQIAMNFKPEKCSSSFFVYGNQRGCHLSELDIDNHGNGDMEIFPFDHIYPIKSTSNRTIFIYGDLGSKQLKNLIFGSKKLVETEENLRFVIRHSEDFSSSEKVSLSGYGVELAIKNTEYKAMDSTSKNDEKPENLHGLNFKILEKRHSNRQKELDSLRENLEKIGEIVPLLKWQLPDLGFKTCEKMGTEKMSIEEIEVLLQDFPMHSRAISHRTLNETFQKSVKKYQEKMKSKGIENGENLLTINGRIVSKEGSNIDLFSLIEIMEQEKKIVDDLMEIGSELEESEDRNEIDRSKMLTLVDLSPIDMSVYAFDYRDTQPVYLNSLESRGSFYKSLHLLLQPFPPGQIRPISRNIFNLILFSDPFDSDDKLFESIQAYLKGGVYIRFGIVPIFDEKKHGMSIEDAVTVKTTSPLKNRIWNTEASLLEALKRGNQFLTKTGLTTQTPVALLNGYPLDVSSPETFDSSLAENIQKQTIHLQMSLFNRRIDDDVNIQEWWLNKETNPHIVERVNQRITKAFNDKNFVQLERKSMEFLKDLHYFSKNPNIVTKNANVTTWIIADFEDPSNLNFAVNLLKSINKNNKIAFIPNPKNPEKSCSSQLDDQFTFDDLDLEILMKNAHLCSKSVEFTDFLTKLGISSGETAVVSNGLIIGPLMGEQEHLTSEDFEFLDNLWKNRGSWKASKFLNEGFKNDVSISFYSAISRTFQKNQPRISFDEFKDLNNQNMIIFPPKDPKSSYITITWIANPVSRKAQHIISIVKLMSKVLNSRVEIIFNPSVNLSEMPIKRFYRFVADPELQFDENGSIENNYAEFSNLPQKQLLTMSIETNDGWMIEVKKAEYDLDNILLESTTSDVEAIFSLEHILVEGASHKTNGEPSDGLEIELKSGEKKYDTIVMINLGYFQLKAEPGVWTLGLRNGTSSENSQIIKIDSKIVENDIKIVVDSFTGKWTKLLVEEYEKSKESETSSIGNLVKSAKNFFASTPPSEVINVFSLASGHLYERFMRIMIVSVMKNTKTQKVKFWLLKNYLSPKFKETIPILADFYGFEYELVEYKWPKWLHQQTEKQRVMWGYKILFLDVLFPLNVDKIIFVDADQVVRADLQELMDYNLRGAPYGYVPFCESRKEMEGFRFWKSGYWKNHLMGRNYHISALYVVDLKAFRRFSAGDRLRGRYDSLSVDPNSLSNLDQDLPNNMIHEVPIKSLPQEWLWCETWCNDDSKQTAKTIDLCNNPLTKEPKLSSAQRIIGEWKDLDDEISEVILNSGRKSKKLEVEEKEKKEEL